MKSKKKPSKSKKPKQTKAAKKLTKAILKVADARNEGDIFRAVLSSGKLSII
jgi:hypothetical protein